MESANDRKVKESRRKKMPERETKGEENIRTAQEERERRKNSLCSLSFLF